MGIDGRSVSDRMGWHLVSGHFVGHWVANKIDGSYWEEKSQAIGLEKDGEIIAGVIYESYNGRSLVVHLAIEGRINKKFLAAVFGYGFNSCGIEKAIAPVSSSNNKIKTLVEKMGFVKEATIKDADPKGDVEIYTMRRKDCRFLEDRYGKEL
jgi:RimJ/RimL family protein N-acetyltransferase